MSNIPTYYYDPTLVAARALETPNADWVGGLNRGGSNTNGIGIATGFYDPAVNDWARIEDTAAHESQHIGEDATSILLIQGADVNDEVAFVQADADTADGAVLDAVTGATNETGVTVPADSWVWGVIPNA